MNKNNFVKVKQNFTAITVLLLSVYYLMVAYSARPNVDNIQYLVINLYLDLFQGSWMLVLIYGQIYGQIKHPLEEKTSNIKQLGKKSTYHIFILILGLILLRLFNPEYSWQQNFSDNTISIVEQFINAFIISFLMTILDFFVNKYNIRIFSQTAMVVGSFFASFAYLLYLSRTFQQQILSGNFNVTEFYTTNILFWLYFYCLAKWMMANLKTITNYLKKYISVVVFIFLLVNLVTIYLAFSQPFTSPYMNPLYLIVYTGLFGIVHNISIIFRDKDSLLMEIINERLYIIAILIPMTTQAFRVVFSRYFDSTLLFIFIGLFFVLSSAIGISIFVKPLKRS